MTDDDPMIGREIGHCRIERKLGSGGMGTVYLARHAGLNKSVAVKILPPQLAGNPEYIARFLREARMAARLEHPHVVQVFDVGEQGGVYYITMQYVEGRSLDVVLKERKKLSVSEALAIARRVTLALAAAHKLGIVHRDIKPANILISKEGVVKVADFGLAKDTESNRSISEPGQIVGTPYYMSPEQAQGEKLDHRSDLYSLGATLYHMVTGQRAFEGGTPLSIVVKAMSQDPTPPQEIDPSIPPGVSALIAKLMAKKPEARHVTADELLRDLEAMRTGVAPSRLPGAKGVESAPAAAAASPPAKSRRAAMIALPVAAILVVGIVIGVVLGRGEKPAAPASAKTPAGATAVKPAAAPAKASADPPAGRPEDKPPAPLDPRQALAGRVRDIKDATERRLTEELIARCDELLRAVQKKDGKAVRAMFDRLTFGDPTDHQMNELFARVLSDKAELESGAVDDVQVRLRPFQPPSGTCRMTYHVKSARGDAKIQVEGQPLYWLYRRDGGWMITKSPRPSDK